MLIQSEVLKLHDKKFICIYHYRPDCSGKNGVYVSHPVDKRLYVLCVKGSPNSMHVCPPGEFYSPNNVPPCQFHCMGLGDFPDFEDPQK